MRNYRGSDAPGEEGGNVHQFKLIGGQLCLDFANTADFYAIGGPRERLVSFGALVHWARQAGIVGPREEAALRKIGAIRRREATGLLSQAIALREAIDHALSALAHRREPPARALESLNRMIAVAVAHARLARQRDRFMWDWKRDLSRLDWILWPIVWSAAEALTSDHLGRVRECASDDGCGWFFLDTSRNGSRRWCDMSHCGNRAKARRHYQRVRTQAARA
jgi:predicted RNA-binding Zn ribbon-like protein